LPRTDIERTDIGFLQRLSAVLPAGDSGPMEAIVADEEQCPAAGAGAHRDGQSRRPALDIDRRRGFLAQSRLSESMIDGRLIRTDGVELAVHHKGRRVDLGAHAERGLDQEYRAINPATTRVILVQSAPRVLPAFSQVLSTRAERSL
jgi:hypothetical protein